MNATVVAWVSLITFYVLMGIVALARVRGQYGLLHRQTKKGYQLSKTAVVFCVLFWPWLLISGRVYF